MCRNFEDNWWKWLICIVVITILAWITTGLIYDWTHPISSEERARREFTRECQRPYGAVAYTLEKPWVCDRP